MVRLIFEPAEAIVFADPTEEGLRIDDVDRRHLCRAAVDAQAAARAMIGIDHRHENGVLAQFARMGLEAERFVSKRTIAIADFAAQALPAQTRIWINGCNAHASLADIVDLAVECTRRTNLCTRDVLAHIARNFPRLEIRCAVRRLVAQLGELQGIVGTGLNAETAADALVVELGIGARGQRFEAFGFGGAHESRETCACGGRYAGTLQENADGLTSGRFYRHCRIEM